MHGSIDCEIISTNMGGDICTDHNSHSGSPPLDYNTANVRSRIYRSYTYSPASNNKPSVRLEVCTSSEYQQFYDNRGAIPHIQIVQYNSGNRFKGSENESDICNPFPII
ncbi:11223_t:CDS:2 [Dentiscutata heterogama]|uniref:11223_t:CDS:1 n=1 Tax=Dentiscutata heterogama TaxID=1316150 RepID=A0ACA9LZI4_9GLOM|nr:11223_t:CDS:2 [Dentiscutata heterogama]